jgi:CheY-like chemotaxis protein
MLQGEFAEGVVSLILAVDDEADILLIIGVTLRRCGHEVLEATSGEKALEILDRERPDAMLLDIRMPGIDGLEVLERLRDARRLASLPVIMLSAYSNPAMIERAREIGCREFVTKPFFPDQLAATLEEVLRAGASPAA